MTEIVHTHVPFHFFVPLPFEKAAPLFGAWAEKSWEPGWDPTFLFPAPPADQEGAVFTVSHGPGHDSTWVNTAFDLAAGHVQYVVFQDGTIVTRIDIHLTREGEDRTEVSVVYERTALVPSANTHVDELARGDREKAPAWQKAIETYARTLEPDAR